MTNPADNFATPRVAAGALFVDGDRVLLVHKTYGSGWDIPGGYLDRGESPAQACEREIREELGLNRTPGRLLVLDWAPTPRKATSCCSYSAAANLAMTSIASGWMAPSSISGSGSEWTILATI